MRPYQENFNMRLISLSSRVPPPRGYKRYDRGFVAFILLSCLILICCAKKNTNNNTPSFSLEQNKLYFLTSNYPNSYLYSLNLSNQNILFEPTPATLSGDIIGFEKKDSEGNLQNLYMVERFSAEGLPSRVTTYSDVGSIQEDTKNFPQNVYDMILVNNFLYSIGFDKKEISKISFRLDSISVEKMSVQGFQNNAFADSESFQAILNNNNSYYVLTVGSLNSTTEAKIYKLDPTLTQKSQEAINSWPITDSNNAITCYRMSPAIQRISNSKIVISCNPSFASLSGIPTVATPSLFLIDVSASKPIITVLATASSSIDMILGGASKDKNSVFITEEIYDAKNYFNMTIQQSYWLNISNPLYPVKTVNNKVAYAVTYNNKQDAYVFSCVLNNSMQCLKNSFGVSQNSINNFSTSQFETIFLNKVTNLNGTGSFSFFKDL